MFACCDASLMSPSFCLRLMELVRHTLRPNNNNTTVSGCLVYSVRRLCDCFSVALRWHRWRPLLFVCVCVCLLLCLLAVLQWVSQFARLCERIGKEGVRIAGDGFDGFVFFGFEIIVDTNTDHSSNSRRTDSECQ